MTAGETVDPEDLFDLAMDHHDAGSPAEAESLCHQILELDAAHGGALFYLGASAYAEGRFDVATELLGRMVADQPDDAKALYLLATGELKLDRIPEAIDHFQQMLALEPNALAHCHLGELLYKTKQYDAAIGHFQAALALDPDNVDTLCRLGTAQQVCSRFEEAAASYRQALTIQPEAGAALTNLAQILHMQNRVNEAIAIYRRAPA